MNSGGSSRLSLFLSRPSLVAPLSPRQFNHAPSFSCGSSLDLKIKLELLRNTMRLIHLQGESMRETSFGGGVPPT